MSTISFTVGGKHYTIDCEEGQEGHIRQLVAKVNKRFDVIRSGFGESPDATILVVMAVMMQDEMDKIAGGEAPVIQQQSTPIASNVHQLDFLDPVVDQIDTLAKRLESL